MSKLSETYRYHSIAEVAEALGWSVKTVRRRIEDGSLKVTRFNSRCIRISEEDFVAYLRSIDSRPRRKLKKVKLVAQ